MRVDVHKDMLIGVGVYTPAEAGRLLRLPPARIVRWLRGYRANARAYRPLWTPEIDLGDGRTYLGFRDLMEARIADQFIARGVSPQRVRAAILLAREVLGAERPLSTHGFRTDGRDLFVQVVTRDEAGEERERLLNLFSKQYEFQQIIGPLLKTVDFDEQGEPVQWWPSGRRANILVSPAHAFGQPIEAETAIPTAALAAAAGLEGIDGAARSFAVPVPAIRRALAFERALRQSPA